MTDGESGSASYPAPGTQLMLLDSASLYYRAFFGMPATVTSPDGVPVNAVRGFLDIVAKLVGTYTPTHLVACWDEAWRPTWRVRLLPTYKAHRVVATSPDGRDLEDTPAALRTQIPIIREVLTALGVPIVGAADYEADDVIASLATTASRPVSVVTGDRDLFQLVDDAAGIRVIYTARGMSRLDVLTEADIFQRYGVTAAQYADFATLRGDPSDGLPGVAGVGEKTAATLLATHGSLDDVRAAAAAGTGMTARMQQKILDAADYLDAAPDVVRVVRDLTLPVPDTRLTTAQEAGGRVAQLSTRWGLGAAMTRLLDVLPAA